MRNAGVGGNGARRAPPSAASGSDADPTSDILSLLTVVRAHQRQHEDPAYDSAAPVAIQRCKTMLSKLRKLLPKLMRPIATVPVDVGVPMLRDICEIVELLLRGSVCPHSLMLFIEGKGGASAPAQAAKAVRGRQQQAASANGAPASSYPAFATMLFYMVSFFSSSSLREAQGSVLGVILQMALFLQQHDVYGFLHFFRDTVEVLQDCFLLEESLKVRDFDPTFVGASIASYLDTAIHVYQDADGPLGSRSNITLCGCEPAADEAKLSERRQHLKQMLPPIHVESYSSAIALRRSMLVLAQRIVQQSHAAVASDPASDKLVQLVQLFAQKNDALRLDGGAASRHVRVSQREVAEVTEATFSLLQTMLAVGSTTERKFVRLALAFYKHGAFDPSSADSTDCVGSVLKAIRDGQCRISRFAAETLWTALDDWLCRSFLKSEGALRIPLNVKSQRYHEIWLRAVEIVVYYLRSSAASQQVSVFLDLLGCVDVTELDLSSRSAIVGYVHYVLSSRSLLLKFTHSFAKSLQTNSFELGNDGSLNSTSRKRTRGGTFVGGVPQTASASHQARVFQVTEEARVHETLAQWVLDLVFFGSGSAIDDVVALSIALRVVLPFRDFITSVARAESYSIFRVLVQRVDSVMSSFVLPVSDITDEAFDFLIIALRHLEDSELAKYSATFKSVLSAIETKRFFAGDEDMSEASPWEEECWAQLVATMPHPMKPVSHGSDDEISQSELFAAASRTDLVSKMFNEKNLRVRAVFLMHFMWSRSKALKVTQESPWRDSGLWKTICRSIMDKSIPQSVARASVGMMPLLVSLLKRLCVSPSDAAVGLLELLSAKTQGGVSDFLRATILDTASSILCIASTPAPALLPCAESGHGAWMERIFGAPSLPSSIKASVLCDCWQGSASPRMIAVPIALIESLAQVDSESQSIEMRTMTIRWLASAFRHCELKDDTERILSSFTKIFARSYDDPPSCQVISDVFGGLVAYPPFAQVLLSSAELSGGDFFTKTVAAVLSKVEETFDVPALLAVMPILGSIGSACDPGTIEHMEVLVWVMLRLTSIWSKAQVDKVTECAAAAYNQIYRITTHHQISWRRLCVENPGECYYPLVDELMPSQTLRLFLRTFMGSMDATQFLSASAPYVLPKYVVDRNDEMLQAFMTEFHGSEEESSGGYEDGSEGDDFRNTSIGELMRNHIEFVLKELIMHQVGPENADNRLAELEFLFKFLPENSTVRDVISHSPLRLLNLVAWELSGPRGDEAESAFREISKYLNQDQEVIDVDSGTISAESGGLIMPRQYFLALMTELGNKIGEKGPHASPTADKIRAIKSINRLFDLFKSSSPTDTESSSSNGVVDSFVPKVMATLKIGLIERELQEHAMNAWATFLQMLSVKALETNFCSIVVSLLPCIGYDPGMILQEGLAVPSSPLKFCWNVDVLQKVLSSDSQLPASKVEEKKSSAFSVATNILFYLFMAKKNELKQAFPRIPLLPSLPELDEIYVLLEEVVGDPASKPLGEYLVDLASYVNHWDMAVREMALTQLFRCLVIRGSELKALMENEGYLFVDRAIVDIILSILQLARTESQEIVKILCARCLGALGAIDAARMPLSMFYESGSAQSGIVAKDKSDTRVEYSTKDLACVLIETWLVKELRAAPENTDSVAFAIQELLKFLAELTADPQHSGQNLSISSTTGAYHKPKAAATPIMPEWMKRRFERKEVLQFVEPYWSTNYSVASNRSQHSKNYGGGRRQSGDGAGDRSLHPALDDISYYEKHGTSYEDWLLSWCKRLIHLSQPPERKIFWACRTALTTSPQIARFLLPYLIQNVLRSGKPDVYGELKREVMAVLNDQDRGIMVDEYMVPPSEIHATGLASTSARGNTDTDGENAFGEDSSRHHQCSQTIFSTIEELNEWVWNSEKKRLALSGSASRQSAGSARSVDIPSELEDQEKENLEEFLKDIPSQALSNAAFGIEAYARAIQYFEVYLRQQDFKPPSAKDGSHSYSPWPVHLSLVSKNAFYLQQLYKSVDEPDALIGLATLRRLYEAQRHNDGESDARFGDREDGLNLTDLMHQVVDHEQLAQWEDALACYEQAIQEIQTALSSRAFFSTASQLRRQGVQLPRGLLADPQTDPELVKPELYSGMIGCLIQLGRLESALQHINGIVTQEPEFMGTLFPYALECAWRLSRWELLTDLLSSEKKNALLLSSSAGAGSSVGHSGGGSRLRGIDVSQLKLIRVLHSLHNGELDSFQRNLKDARLEVMGPLAAASAESYQRAYPLLHKLHFLHEAEQGFIFLQTAKEVGEPEEKTERWKKQAPWDARYDSMPTSLKFRDPILALRRVLLQEASLRNEVSHYWLLQAKLARKEGYVRTASSAVMHAEALDNQYALLEKAKLMVSQDRMYEALQLLEPVDIDASKLDFNVDDPHFCAKNLLLATNWMQASGQRQGKKVIERYQAVIQFDPTWEKGYFFLAKYYEYLLSVSHPEATASMGEEGGSILLDSVFRSHLLNLMKNYVLALQHGTKFVFQSLPRLLTLWFEYGELLYAGSKGSKASKTLRLPEFGLSQSTTEQQILASITEVIHDAVEKLPAYEWLVCFPQVTSRICHPNPIVVDGVKQIMVKVLGAYPTQAMWPLLGLSRSLNSQRRNRARDIIANIQRHFVSLNQQEIANSFSEGMRLVEELISLAGHDPANQRKINIRLSRIRSKILVPVQTALTTVLPASGLAPEDKHHTAFSPHGQIHIKAFSDKADVMMTKEKPKRIEVLGSDGRLYPFLCKREKTGDLRKDARMMEFNTMINKLLQKDGEGRKRKLRLRTYAVVCLNEESGLMEWVRNTKAMRQLIGQIHKTERGFIQPVRLTHDIKERFLGMQKKYADNSRMMAMYYRRKILALPVFTPRFHQWFYNNFADPTAWFESRMTFSRSAAVWSMVGHIIGLGDRHGENILIDCTNGECVHVDFDCLFDKGLKLAKPEIVPFRLTPNIIDAFGITGHEGVFRRVCEVTMHLLRENKETLRSVLESFIHDPLVEWGRKGKAAQVAPGASSATRSIAEISTDRSKEETRIILKTIDDRLRGIYNLGDAIRPLVSSSHRNILPENETLPLSVQGQVDKLIHEATSHENLAQMYIGWMPFL